ncbi:BTB/POZ and MATH domain-containing protein 2 isoform X1 [Lolium perenne]|uniref:BTB/POZ and MATH domain-containing protein 2 isoform X1 n=1 Tax=Lolium perenne TaxID=4522 RepID=UPI0021EACDEC|nr:BTB/POZ and MATH domain-containing protein 2-like isoform X1 [Lolium perenne]
MSSFSGVSVVTEGKHCTTSVVNARTESGYHLLVVKDYSRTVQQIPNGEMISSGAFMVGGHQWSINYSPNGVDPSSADFISLLICLHGDDDEVEEVTEAKFEFSFIDQVEYQKPVYIRSTETRIFSSKGDFHGYTLFVKRDALERSAHLKDDCFTIRCDIMVCKDPSAGDAVGTLSDVHQHFDHLLQNKVGADVTFEVNGQKFAAHRCVLAARSKVFMAQLFGPMTESNTSSVIHIKDMEAKVFAGLLKFIYTDSFPEMDKDNNMEEGGQDEEKEEEVEYVMWLQDLFVAADRYELQRLKLLCEGHLAEGLCVSSVASTLALAEQHYCHGLKEACLKFIQDQSLPCLEKVMATDSWELIVTTYPSVLKEIIAKVASSHKHKKRKQ